jgi:RNA polymerase sigma-70 factor (ECF subfamily)
MAGGAQLDLELLERWRGGDREAGNQLVRRLFPAIRRYFRNKLTADYEDLVQETFTRLVHARDDFRGEASLRTYVFRISRNVLAEHLRRRYLRGRHFAPATSSIVEVVGRRPSSLMLELESRCMLLEALRMLSLDDQDLLELYYWENLSGRELAEVPVPTTRSRLRAAIGRLRQAYRKLGRELDTAGLERELRDVLRPKDRRASA